MLHICPFFIQIWDCNSPRAPLSLLTWSHALCSAKERLHVTDRPSKAVVEAELTEQLIYFKEICGTGTDSESRFLVANGFLVNNILITLLILNNVLVWKQSSSKDDLSVPV